MTGLFKSSRRKLDAQALYRKLFHTLQVPRDARIYVGLSGGLDSVVLLHVLAELRRCTDISLTALHAHHGIHPNADEWQGFCGGLCAAWSVGFKTRKLDVGATRGEGLEASARKARYRWCLSMLQTTDYLLLAHHRDDQAETLLLNLLRGAGVRGLSGMSPVSEFEQRIIVRPLLDYDRRQLRAYAEAHELQWIEDASNRDIAYSRNYLRHQVVPLLQQRWPSVNDVLADTSGRMRRTQLLLEEVATADLQLTEQQVLDAVTGTGYRLNLSALYDLSDGRMANLVTAWLRQTGFSPPSQRQLQQVTGVLIRRRTPTNAIIRWPGAELRKYDDWLYALQPLPRRIEPEARIWDIEQPLTVPELNLTIAAIPARGAGLARSRIKAPLIVKWRHGGERCLVARRAHHKKLKKLLQEHRVPPWVRERIPLLYIEDEIAAVADYWYCAPFAAAPDEPGMAIEIRALQAHL